MGKAENSRDDSHDPKHRLRKCRQGSPASTISVVCSPSSSSLSTCIGRPSERKQNESSAYFTDQAYMETALASSSMRGVSSGVASHAKHSDARQKRRVNILCSARDLLHVVLMMTSLKRKRLLTLIVRCSALDRCLHDHSRSLVSDPHTSLLLAHGAGHSSGYTCIDT